MKSTIYTPCFLIIILSFLVSCGSDDDDMGFELLENNELEEGFGKPVGWNFLFNAVEPSSTFDFDWTTREALSGNRSLKIDIDSDNPDEFASWTTTLLFNQSDLTGQEIELSVWVKANLSGEGVILIIRGDSNGEIVRQETTQFAKSITGDFDWKNVTLETTVENNIDSYSIFLMLSGSTSGEVFFDDVSLKLK